jgi:hypothetical protein
MAPRALSMTASVRSLAGKCSVSIGVGLLQIVADGIDDSLRNLCSPDRPKDRRLPFSVCAKAGNWERTCEMSSWEAVSFGVVNMSSQAIPSWSRGRAGFVDHANPLGFL